MKRNTGGPERLSLTTSSELNFKGMNENITSESGQVEKMKTAKENYGKVSTL